MFTKLPKSATEMVEIARQASTSFITLIPGDNYQSLAANIAGAQFSVATVIAEQFDKSCDQMKKMFLVN